MEFSEEIDIEQVLKADLERISRMLTDGSLEGLDEDSLLSTLPSPWPIETAGSSISSKTASSENDFHGGRTTKSAFDLAAKEGDQEEMSDRLQSLLSRSEEYDDKVRHVSSSLSSSFMKLVHSCLFLSLCFANISIC